MHNRVKIEVFSTGYCMASERIAIQSGKRRQIKFHANSILILHPEQGPVLFDTGYAPRFFEVTRSWPERIQRLTTPSTIEDTWSISQQLTQYGISPEEINMLIVSHFHADHICGLKDFPQAQVYASQSGYQQIQQLGRFAGVRRGLIKGLLPQDIDRRIHFFDEQEKVERQDAFGYHYDLFDDGSVKVIPLPGHALGQIGLLLNEGSSSSYFLAADAYWLTESLDTNVLPSKITQLFIDSWKAYVSTFQKVREYRAEHPETIFISCHCPQVHEQLAKKIY